MNFTSSPVLLHLLADRKLAPGAALLVFDAPAQDALSLLVAHPAFAAFVAEFPCLLGSEQASGLPPELLADLQAAGCRVTDAAAFHRSDTALKPVLPTSALWLDGDWPLAPPQRPTGTQSASRVLALKLLQLVMADAETRDIEAVLRQDPTLSYHLLRLVNSLGMGMTRRITSFSQAILILGRKQLQRWLNLMLFAARSDDYRAPMLLARVVVRARTMELLTKEIGLDLAGQDLAFMAGMFSMLGILFGMSLAELIRPLQLSDVLVDAIIDHQGEIGRLLQLLEYAEQSDAASATDLLAGLRLTAAQFTFASLEACQWMLGIAREMKGSDHD
ncbi:MAG TPA: HDOD domain-containing protein [Rhodoferax sp.]|nr:HDOD domain-containing protein [Rhodoferax sp.]